jgi:hypothetical protein
MKNQLALQTFGYRLRFFCLSTLFWGQMLCALSAHARIGESVSECENRYGVTSKIRYIGENAPLEANARPKTSPLDIPANILVKPVIDLRKSGELPAKQCEEILAVACSHSYWHSLKEVQLTAVLSSQSVESLKQEAQDFGWRQFLTSLERANAFDGQHYEFERMEAILSLAGTLRLESEMRPSHWVTVSEKFGFSGIRSWSEKDVVVCLFDTNACQYFSYYEIGLPIKKAQELIKVNVPDGDLEAAYKGKVNCNGAVIHFWDFGNGYQAIFTEGQAFSPPAVSIFRDIRPQATHEPVTMMEKAMRAEWKFFDSIVESKKSELDAKRKARDESLFK